MIASLLSKLVDEKLKPKSLDRDGEQAQVALGQLTAIKEIKVLAWT